MNRIWMMGSAWLIAISLSLVSVPVSAHRPGVGVSVGVVVAPRSCGLHRVCQGWRVREGLRAAARAERRAARMIAAGAARSPAEQDALALERLYRREGKTDAAVQMYEEILRRGNDPALTRLAHRRLALWAYKHNQPEQAEAHLRANLEAAMAR